MIDTLTPNLCREKRYFKPRLNEHKSVKLAQKKNNNNNNLESRQENSNENFVPLLSHPYFLSNNFMILRVLTETFPTETKPRECPAKEKKYSKRNKKAKEAERRESKRQKFGRVVSKYINLKMCLLCIPKVQKL